MYMYTRSEEPLTQALKNNDNNKFNVKKYGYM